MWSNEQKWKAAAEATGLKTHDEDGNTFAVMTKNDLDQRKAAEQYREEFQRRQAEATEFMSPGDLANHVRPR
jgi:ribosome biogenesis GTPase A